MLPHISPFSEGYYLVSDLWVEPYRAEGSQPAPRIQADLYAHIREDLYEGRSPVVLKHSRRHFVVEPDESVPIDTLEIPADFFWDLDIGAPPSREGLLLATPETAYQFTQSGSTI